MCSPPPGPGAAEDERQDQTAYIDRSLYSESRGHLRGVEQRGQDGEHEDEHAVLQRIVLAARNG